MTDRERHLAAIAASAASGRHVRLKTVLRRALEDDAALLAGIREVVFQLVAYCGWAVALNAVSVVREVVDELGLVLPAATGAPPLEDLDRAALRSLGHTTARRVHPRFDRVASQIAAFDPDLVAHLTESAYGYVYNRPGLDLETREIVAVAILAAVGQERQLRYHIEGALNVGVRKDTVTEVQEIVDRILLEAE
jgi:4-carboxymuconolactone decarboxylase